jgi:hypothetical protein
MRIGGSAVAALSLLSLFLDLGVDAKGNKVKPPPGTERGPVQIGEHHAIQISSIVNATDIEPIPSPNGQGSVYTLMHVNASYIAVHFSNMDLPTRCFIEISDALGEQKTVMRGRGRHNRGSFWARHVVGDTMIITMQCIKKKREASFNIDDYVSGFPDIADYIPEWGVERRNLRQSEAVENPFVDSRALATCGANDNRNVACYKTSHPTEYSKARAVARLFINGSGACTGWLVGPNSMLMTNQHCIKTLSDVLNTDFEFMGEEPTCASTTGDCWMCARGTIFDGTALLVVDVAEDFALVQLANNPAATYGYVDLTAFV